MDFKTAEEHWIRCDQCFKVLEKFKTSLRRRANGQYARFDGVYGVWIVSPQKGKGKARVSFVYDKGEVPDFVPTNHG